MIAISSAFKKALIAVDIDGKQAFCELDSDTKHAESMLPAIDNILEENVLNLKDNDSFCVVVGPGSFTGLRIGIALVKGLIQGDDLSKNVYPITSFDLMAYSYIRQNHPSENFTCVINALSGLYFVCEYDKNGKKLGKERMINSEDFQNISGLKVGLDEENILTEQVNVSAKDLLDCALIVEKNGQGCSYKDLVPLYLRKSQAESAMEEKINKKN